MCKHETSQLLKYIILTSLSVWIFITNSHYKAHCHIMRDVIRINCDISVFKSDNLYSLDTSKISYRLKYQNFRQIYSSRNLY